MRRPRRLRRRWSRLSIPKILAWADYEFQHFGRWPRCTDGEVNRDPNERWYLIDCALRVGYRGLSGGSSLPQLLAEARGVRNIGGLPRFEEEQIVIWAQAHRKRTGKWPYQDAGANPEAPGETWESVNRALIAGTRGTSGGETLAQLLSRCCGARTKNNLPMLTVKKILAWADAHRKLTGQWPRVASGKVTSAPGETWLAIDSALREGTRGLRTRSSLARLLTKYRGARNKAKAPHLTHEQILRWADAFHRRTGRCPGQTSGPIPRSGGETWLAVQNALWEGLRGFPGGDSLHQLLVRTGRKSLALKAKA